MKSIITNAAEITVLDLIDHTDKTGGGPTAVGATVVRARKGPVNKSVQVRYSNFEKIFGIPYPARAGQHMEGLRHVNDAAQFCSWVNVVRVVASDARFPSVAFKNIAEKGAWADATAYVANDVVTVADGSLICITGHTSATPAPTVAAPGTTWVEYTGSAVNANHAYGSTLVVGDGIILQAWIDDGDESANRSIEIEKIVDHKGAWAATTTYAKNDVVLFSDGNEYLCRRGHVSEASEPTPTAVAEWRLFTVQDQRFKINLYDKTNAGEEYLLESYEVGIVETDRDDMGRPAFITSVLEQRSDRIRAEIGEDLTWAGIQDGLTAATKAPFTGGSGGGEPEAADWIAAWDIYRNEKIPAFLLFAAGNYDEVVLANAIDIAEYRHNTFFFDAPYWLDSEAAQLWLQSTGLESRQAACFHCPHSAIDEWYGGQTAWGVSGAVAAACAKGDAHFTGSTPGVHYAPAGRDRGKLERVGPKPLFPMDYINRDDFYDTRLNPVIAGDNGGLIIDDSLTIHYRQNYSRFIWVNRIANYIDYRFLEMAEVIKHEPDGITRRALNKGIEDILEEMVRSEALSKPREPDIDGDSPYVFTVVQEEIDLWVVTWSFCPTGSARRIAGQPRLIR